MSDIKDGFGKDVDDDVGGIALAYGVAPFDGKPQTVELTAELRAALHFLAAPPGEGMAKRLFDALKRVRELEAELHERNQLALERSERD